MLNFIVFGIETRLVELSVFFFFGFSRSAYREVDILIGFRPLPLPLLLRCLRRRILGRLYFDAFAAECYFLPTVSMMFSSSSESIRWPPEGTFSRVLFFASSYFPPWWLGTPLLCSSGKTTLHFFATFNLMRNFLEGPQIFFSFSRFATLLFTTHNTVIGICRSQGKPRGKIFSQRFINIWLSSLYTLGVNFCLFFFLFGLACTIFFNYIWFALSFTHSF